MKIALKEVIFTDLVWRIARTKFTLFSMEREVIGKNCIFQLTIMGQLLMTEYSKFKISVADYFFNMSANCLEENMMDFSFMTSTTIKKKGR